MVECPSALQDQHDGLYVFLFPLMCAQLTGLGRHVLVLYVRFHATSLYKLTSPIDGIAASSVLSVLNYFLLGWNLAVRSSPLDYNFILTYSLRSTDSMSIVSRSG